MDVASPPLHKRAGPSGRLRAARNVDPHQVIRKALDQHPNATADQIASILQRWGHPVSGVWIARQMQTRAVHPGDGQRR
jgi:hypothetical protein